MAAAAGAGVGSAAQGRRGEAGRRGGEFAFQAEVEGVAGVEEEVDRLAAEEVAEAVQLLQGRGVLGAAAEVEIDQGDQALGMEEFKGPEGAGGKRQVDIAEMEDAEAHGGAV